MISHEAPLPRLEHTFSLPLLCMSCAVALSHLTGLPAGLTPLSQCLSCTWKPQTRHSIPGAASQVPSRGKHHFYWPARCASANTAQHAFGFLHSSITLHKVSASSFLHSVKVTLNRSPALQHILPITTPLSLLSSMKFLKVYYVSSSHH